MHTDTTPDVRAEHVREAQATGKAVAVYPALFADERADVIKARRRRGPKGWSGVDRIAGFDSIDANRSVSPEKWFGTPDAPGLIAQIPRSDPLAQLVCAGHTQPLLSLEWRFTPASSSEQHKRHAQFLNDVTSPTWMPGGLLGLVAQAATTVHRGFMLFEPWMKRSPEYELIVDGVAVKTGGAFLPRVQTILPWAVDQFDPLGHPKGSVRLYPERTADSAVSGVVLRRDEYIHLRHNPEGDNPSPPGILRGLYGPWLRRRNYWRLESIGLDRAAMGILVCYVEPEANLDDLDEVRAILAEVRVSARGYVVLPKGYRLEIVQLGFNGKDVEEALAAAAREMLQGARMQFADNGIQGIGSYASNAGHLAFFAQDLRATAAMITGCFASMWAAVIEANFSGEARGRYPQLTHSPIAVEDDAGKIATAVTQLVNAGVMEIRPEDRQRLRKKLGLPMLDEEDLERLGAVGTFESTEES